MDGEYLWSFACLLLFVSLLDNILCSKNDISEVRYPEIMFKDSTKIYNQTVTCDNIASDARFPSDTWSCHNIRIGGKKLRHLFMYHESNCGEKGRKKNDFDGKNDIAELCRALMKEHGIHRELWAAFIHKPSCGYKKEKMMIFTLGSDPNHHFRWNETMSKGYATTIRCMAVEKN